MNPERLHFLLSACMDGALTPEQKRELEHALRTSAAARAQYWEAAQLHAQLRTVLGDCGSAQIHPADAGGTRAGNEPAPEARNVPAWKTLLHRPIAALAAGVVISALFTSVVWAYAGQRILQREKSIQLLSTDFENIAHIPAEGVPRQPRAWSGDYSRLAGPEQGVLPRSGKKMLRFLRADNALSQKGSANYVAEAIHLVDLRPYRGALLSDDARVEIAGWFASVAASPGQKVRFLIKAACFAGSPEEAPDVWNEFSRVCLSMVQRQGEPDPAPGTWTPLSVSLPVAANADFLVFECAVMQVHPFLSESTAEFAGHYLDDVTVNLREGSPPSKSPAPPAPR
jgi:hypothetical protein